MSTSPEPTNFAQREVAVTGALALWIVTNGLGLLARYAHLGSGQLNALGSNLTPILSGMLLAVFGTVLRRYVTPAWKLAQAEAAKVGIIMPDFPEYTDAEIAAANAAAIAQALDAPAPAPALSVVPPADPPAPTV